MVYETLSIRFRQIHGTLKETYGERWYVFSSHPGLPKCGGVAYFDFMQMEVMPWCVEQFGQGSKKRWRLINQYRVAFKFPNDAFAFKLRWG